MNVFQSFYQENRAIVIPHITLTLLLFPLEILLLSYISGRIFQRIKDKKQKTFFMILVVFFIIFLILQVMHFCQDYLNSLIIPRLDTFVRTNIMDHVLETNQEIDPLELGELMHRVAKTPGHVYKHYHNVVNYLIPFVICGVFFVGYLLWIEWRIGGVVAVVFLALYVIYFAMYQRMTVWTASRFDEEHSLMDQYEDTLSNWESIRQSNTHHQEIERMIRKSQEYETTQQTEINRVNRCKIVSILVLNFVLFFILVSGVFLTTRNNSTFPMWRLIILITAILLMSRTMTTLVVKCTDAIYHHGSVNQFETFLSQHQDPQSNPTVSSKNIDSWTLVLDHVSYHYPSSNQLLLQEVNLTIPFRQSTLIVGEIGSGKSTLFKLIMGIITPSSGTIQLGGVMIPTLSTQERMKIFAYMNQNVQLFHRTVSENIFYGVPRPENYRSVLQNLGTPARILSHLDSSMGRQGRHFSGGERQIVLLLRMYFKPCRIVLLDEPTANLDPHSTRLVVKMIQKIMQTKTVICITHDIGLSSFFERVHVLHNGTLQAKSI